MKPNECYKLIIGGLLLCTVHAQLTTFGANSGAQIPGDHDTPGAKDDGERLSSDPGVGVERQLSRLRAHGPLLQARHCHGVSYT
jgi:hypothetical protein